MGENLRIQLIIHTACETWMNESLCVQKVAKHLPERKIVFWHLRHFHKLKFSMKSLAFLCLICAPNLYFAQKLLRRTKKCWVTRTAKKFLQEPKVVQKLPSTIGTGLLVVVLPSVTEEMEVPSWFYPFNIIWPQIFFLFCHFPAEFAVSPDVDADDWNFFF